ncbi:reverse transcriptase domain-containing protein [Tanacetum coccineum]
MVPNEEDRVERFIGEGPGLCCKESNRRSRGKILVDRMWPELIRLGTMKERGHFRKDCPKLRNQNRGNQTRNKNGNKTGNQTGGNETTARAYAIGGGGTNPDSNVVTGTFLLNNCYASMLFDSGADRSFVSTTFSALLDVTPTTLDTSYAVELADGRISETVMAISVISVSSDSSEDSVGTPIGRVILFDTILTTILDTTPVITPPTTQTDTIVIPIEIPIIAPTILLSLDYTPTSPDYSPASDTESDPSEDPSSDHIPSLPAISPFLSSTNDTTDGDIPDTPPSPTHGTPFTEITSSI